MSDAMAVIDALAVAAEHPAERVAVARLRGAAGLGSQAARQALASEARGLLGLPWAAGLADSPVRMLAALAGCDALAVLAGLLASGLGLVQAALAGDDGLWVPAWLAAEAGRRAGHGVRVAARRWWLPRAWPLPLEQVLVERVPDAARLRVRVAARASLLPTLGLEGPDAIVGWLRPIPPPRDGEETSRALRRDGYAGMRLLLGGGGALIGAGACLAALAARAAARERGAWRGRAAPGLPLALAGDSVALLPGWLAALVAALGVDGDGAPPECSRAAECALVVAAGGAVLGGPDDELHRLPSAAGRLVRGLPLDWSRVPAIAGAA